MTDPWDDPRVIAGMPCQFQARRARLQAGAKRLGWKVGFGAPASLEMMQLGGPLVGYLMDETVYPSGGTLDVTSWNRPVIEFEVAVFMGADVAPGADEPTVRAAVTAVAPAIELADVDLPIGPESVADILAGNIFHRAVILGAADPAHSGLDISGLAARVMLDRLLFAATDRLEELTGRYPGVVATVAETLGTQGEVLRAGDVIITGSVTPPLPVNGDAVYEFRLDPLPPISVELVGSAGP